MKRAPINGPVLAKAIAPWRLDLREETGSTNADASAAAKAGALEGNVILAEAQTNGRGRMDRSWVSPPRAGLALSILLRPRIEMARWGWLPLLAGVALAETVAALETTAEVALKWPNDLLLDGRKCAGILAEAAVPGAVVVGVGLNVSLERAELPIENATSLQLAGVKEDDRTVIAGLLINRFRERYDAWQAGEDVRETYLLQCGTIGRQVRILLPDGSELAGEATTVDGDGRLVILDNRGELCPIAAGDVTHVR
ncbi:MAG TPA: biotin--[acetyl-CoA-carboxylase] ligase [Micromonosporaceae bacterium]|nr:biotin--[acetyl-CoA-carboxylase] ligase [Micromonosporaceae bacterium]